MSQFGDKSITLTRRTQDINREDSDNEHKGHNYDADDRLHYTHPIRKPSRASGGHVIELVLVHVSW